MLHTYNNLSNTLEPLNEKRLKWYTCGPTVYDSAHLGHARTYVTFDIIRRILEDHFGKQIQYVMNITDIDDKIINRAIELGELPKAIAKRYEETFWQDMDDLHVIRPTRILHVTESIMEIIKFIEILINSGTAYVASDSSVYFDTQKFGAQHKIPFVPDVDSDQTEIRDGKKHSADFALWKVCRSESGWVPSWSKLEGRPGWHIECSTMAHMAFGTHFDIHSGGIDLCFPHHANEIAQSMAYNEAIKTTPIEPIKTFWHSGHLHIEGRKMSKSEKNFITIREALDKYGHTILRLWFLDHHYSAPIHYSEEALVAYSTMEAFYIDWFARLRRISGCYGTSEWSETENELLKKIYEIQDSVDKALASNFDTPSVMRLINELVRETNIYMKTRNNVNILFSTGRYVEKIFKLFGIADKQWSLDQPITEKVIEPIIDALVNFRTAVRTATKSGEKGAILAQCDQVRDVVVPKLGIKIEDIGSKTIWKYIGLGKNE